MQNPNRDIPAPVMRSPLFYLGIALLVFGIIQFAMIFSTIASAVESAASDPQAATHELPPKSEAAVRTALAASTLILGGLAMRLGSRRRERKMYEDTTESRGVH